MPPVDWKTILNDTKLMQKTANAFMKKDYELTLLKENQQYPAILTAIEQHFQYQERKKALLLPELNYENKTVAIFSDYGGESKNSKYYTYSFLICALDHTDLFQSIMKFIRKEYDLDEKEIAFKDVGYGPISRALDDYLSALNMIPGLLLTLVVEKGAASINRKEVKEITNLLKEYNLGEWKPGVVQKLILICNVSAYLVALLAADNQKVFWLTDNDAIAANDDLAANWIKIFYRTLSILSRNNLQDVRCALPCAERRHLPSMDLLSCADIVAGSVEHYFTRLSKGFEDLKDEANKVLEWLCYPTLLRKENIMVKRNEAGIPVASTLRFSPSTPDPTKTTLPIYRP